MKSRRHPRQARPRWLLPISFLFPLRPDHSWVGGRISPSSRWMCSAGHLFYKFGITESDWYRIKQSIDSKCRTAWRRKQRGQSLAVKSFSRRTPSSSSYGASGLWTARRVVRGRQRHMRRAHSCPRRRSHAGTEEQSGLGLAAAGGVQPGPPAA